MSQENSPQPTDPPTLFEWAGGGPALARMTKIFYEKHVPVDPLLGPLFANMAPDHPERVAAWLGEVFGGQKAHTERFGGYERMMSSHLGKELQSSSAHAGCSCSASPPTRRGFRQTPNGARPSSPTSSGGHESPSRTRSRTPSRRRTCPSRAGRGSATPHLDQGSRRSQPRCHRSSYSSSPVPMRRSTSSSTSGPSSARSTVTRCASRSTSGPTTTSPNTPTRSWIDCKPERCPATEPGPAKKLDVLRRWSESGKPT